MLELVNVTREYVMGSNVLKALDDVSLKVDDGEFLSIIGPSGSGKSTLMNIIGCLDTADVGQYYIDGTEVSEFSDNQLSVIRNEKLGFVFQKFNLLPRLSALENVELSLMYRKMSQKERRSIAEKYLESVGLMDRQSHKPNELSGGQQQRV
ncbi:MAG: ATP-binding cassette domain-containing protein, partial [Eubacteriaceae bacterium]|nr:ATP-binding cassette domain-containing protein [Eubacteriaceae bacterium]